jgi:hypothetical protein
MRQTSVILLNEISLNKPLYLEPFIGSQAIFASAVRFWIAVDAQIAGYHSCKVIRVEIHRVKHLSARAIPVHIYIEGSRWFDYQY